MDTLVFVLTILIWPLCVLIIGLILLQGGAGDLSSAFGGGGQLDSTLGVGAGRKMSKLTGWLGVCFLMAVTILAIPRGLHAGDRKLAGAAEDGSQAVMAPPVKDEPKLIVPPGPLAPTELKPIPGAGVPADVAAPAAPAPAAPAPADAQPANAAPDGAAAPAAPKADAPAKLKLDD